MKTENNWRGNYDAKFEDLLGKTIIRFDGLKKGSEEVLFHTSDGDIFKLYHYQDCCESVELEDIAGDPGSVIGLPLLMAELVESDTNPEGVKFEYQDSFTWSFYKLATIKGYVTLRFYGSSNGYYSEKMTFERIDPNASR